MRDGHQNPTGLVRCEDPIFVLEPRPQNHLRRCQWNGTSCMRRLLAALLIVAGCTAVATNDSQRSLRSEQWSPERKQDLGSAVDPFARADDRLHRRKSQKPFEQS